MMLKVAPTRMELLRLRKRIELARRGHKLLQDKLEGLIKEFMPLIEEYVRLRAELDRRTPEVMGLFALVGAETGEAALRTALGQTGVRAEVDLSEQRRANVPVPVLDLRMERSAPHYSLAATPRILDRAAEGLSELLPEVLACAQTEQAVRRLAAEIERTRRRVNALEYIMIPRLQEARKFIQSKLDEDERAARVRNMKVKDLLEKAAGGGR
jgi:V/A-type H+-transporting ATPase subunit D